MNESIKTSYTYVEALEFATPDMIIANFATNITHQTLTIAKTFAKRNHRDLKDKKITPGAINAIILYILVVNNGVMPSTEAYYLKTLEDFKSKRITTTNVIINYFEIYKKASKKHLNVEVLQDTIDKETEAVLERLYSQV